MHSTLFASRPPSGGVMLLRLAALARRRFSTSPLPLLSTRGRRDGCPPARIGRLALCRARLVSAALRFPGRKGGDISPHFSASPPPPRPSWFRLQGARARAARPCSACAATCAHARGAARGAARSALLCSLWLAALSGSPPLRRGFRRARALLLAHACRARVVHSACTRARAHAPLACCLGSCCHISALPLCAAACCHVTRDDGCAVLCMLRSLSHARAARAQCCSCAT